MTVNIIGEMRTISSTLKQMVDYLSAESKGKDRVITGILLLNHPIFPRLNKLLGAGYRIFFETKEEMNNWLRARSFMPVDDVPFEDKSILEWVKNDGTEYLTLQKNVFDESDALIPMAPESWNDGWLLKKSLPAKAPDEDDDVPF